MEKCVSYWSSPFPPWTCIPMKWCQSPPTIGASRHIPKAARRFQNLLISLIINVHNLCPEVSTYISPSLGQTWCGLSFDVTLWDTVETYTHTELNFPFFSTHHQARFNLVSTGLILNSKLLHFKKLCKIFCAIFHYKEMWIFKKILKCIHPIVLGENVF